MVIKIDTDYSFVVSPDFNPDFIPEGYIWDETAFQELVKATDKATADETIYTYGGPQGDTDVDYLNAAELTISSQKYDSEEVVDTTVTANAFNNTGTVTTEGTIAFSVKSFTNLGEFNLDKNGALSASSTVMNMDGGTINLNAGTTLQGSTVVNAGTITVVSDHAAINGAITNHGIIDATKRKLIVVGDLQNANEDDTAEARDNTVITAREFEVTGNVVNYGILGTEMQPDHQIDISGELRNYRQIEVGILTAGSIYSDGYYPEIEEKCTRGYIIAGEVNAGSIDNVSGVIQTAAPKETGVGINVTGTINNGNADGIIAKLNAGLNGWIQAATLNNLGNDIENDNGLIIAGRLTVGDITNNGGISTRIVESTGTITNNATGLFAVTYIDDPTVTGLVEGASINAGTIINGGTFAVYSEAALPTEITVTSIENNGLFEFTGAGFTLTGDIVNDANGQIDVAGTVTGTATITNSGTITIDGSLTIGAISGGGTIRITVETADPIAVTADVSGNIIDLEVTLADLTENSYQFVSGVIGEGVTFQVNGTVYEEGVVIDGTNYVLSTMGGTGLWMVREPDSLDFLTGDFTGSAEDQIATVVYNDTSEGRSSFVTIYSNGDPWGNGLTVDPGWEIAGVGDFNADGQDDILRVSTEGYVVSEMTQPDGSFAAQVLNFKNAGWDILGTGDFNGNGTDDILIANPTAASETVGLLGYWESGTEWTLINGYSAEWECVATGDFNADGKCDMLWMNSFEGEGGLTYNAYCTWILDPSDSLPDWRMVSVANPAEWNFLCSGDFDADGANDIAMINNEGVVGIWGVNDGFLNSWSILSAVTSEWQLAGVADFNADGTDDIAWANTDTGLVGYWQIEDKELASWQTLAHII